MRTRTKMITVAMVAFALAAIVVAPTVAGWPKGNMEEPEMSALAFHDTWRKLWEDHIWWTRMVIIGIFDDLAGTGNYTERLIQNYEDMEDALMPFYEDDAKKLGDLIQKHLLIAAQILVEAKAGHDITALSDTWYANANDIAMTMNDLNSKYWPLDEAKAMWKMHLDLTLEEAVKHLQKDWKGDVEAFDKVHLAALEMADFFSNGIIRQFPQMFTE